MDEQIEKPEQDDVERILIETGVLVPANDLIHYMLRNVTYMKLIESEQFKNSGIDLEEVLDETFITENAEKFKKTAEMLRFVTEKVIAVMEPLPTVSEEAVAEAVELAEELIND